MAMEITAKESDMIRLEGDGAEAVIKVGKVSATLMYLHIPEELLKDGRGAECLLSIEKAAAGAGAKRLVYEFNEDEGLLELFKESGYELSQAGDMISFEVLQLLDSEAVKKTLRMNIPVFKTSTIEELFAFQKDEVVDFLKEMHFPVEKESFGRYDERLSIVSYDEDYHPRAVLLTTKWEEGYLVELLLGFSKTKPQYTLSVCQEFARVLEDMSIDEDPGKVYVYSSADFVKALILRFLDKKYGVNKEYTVMRAKKSLPVADQDFLDLAESTAQLLWSDVADTIMGRRNISEKSFWFAEEKKIRDES